MGNIRAVLVIFALGSLAPHSRGLALGLDNGLSSQILEILHSVPPFRVSPLDDFIILIFYRITISYLGKFATKFDICGIIAGYWHFSLLKCPRFYRRK